MSNRLNLSDAINAAYDTGKDPTFIYNGVTYTFSPQGLIDFLSAIGFLDSSGDNISIDEFGNILITSNNKNTIEVLSDSILISSMDNDDYQNLISINSSINRTEIFSKDVIITGEDNLSMSSDNLSFGTDDVSLSLNGSNVSLNGIPTSDPGQEGYLWNDGGTLKISLGV